MSIAEPAVGVVIAAHNAEGTLGAALASVAAQTIQPRDMVVVDDGSSDRTMDVARRWERALPVRVLSPRPNTGAGLARRDGIAALDTEAVAILDADDYWLPNHLQSMVGAWTGARCIVSARAVRWLPGIGLSSHSDLPRVPEAPEQALMIHSLNFVFVSALFNRDDYDRVGGFRDYRGSEDWDLWIRMIRDGCRVVQPSQETVLYRVSAGSMSGRYETLPAEVATLRAAVEEADVPAHKAAARRALIRHAAALDLRAAYAAAEEGRVWRARRLAVRALGGAPSVMARGVFLVAAPRTGLRMRTSLRWRTGRALRW